MTMASYSIQPRDRIFVKDYGFLSFVRNLSSKYTQKLLDHAKRSATDALKTAWKRAIQKKQKQLATGDLIRNKIVDRITKVSEVSLQNNSVTNEEEIFR